MSDAYEEWRCLINSALIAASNIGGELQLSIERGNSNIEIMVSASALCTQMQCMQVRHARGLRLYNGQQPNSYVKCYIRQANTPLGHRKDKRRTSVVVSNANPTYNERVSGVGFISFLQLALISFCRTLLR